MAPFLFIHGTADEMVPDEQSPNMCAALKKAGVVRGDLRGRGTHGIENCEKDATMTHWKAERSRGLSRRSGNRSGRLELNAQRDLHQARIVRRANLPEVAIRRNQKVAVRNAI
jgi:hypothetical protein